MMARWVTIVGRLPSKCLPTLRRLPAGLTARNSRCQKPCGTEVSLDAKAHDIVSLRLLLLVRLLDRVGLPASRVLGHCRLQSRAAEARFGLCLPYLIRARDSSATSYP